MRYQFRSASPTAQVPIFKKYGDNKPTERGVFTFNNIIRKNYDDQPQHIKERNQQIRELKQGIERLTDQTEQLQRRKNHFSGERQLFRKITGDKKFEIKPSDKYKFHHQRMKSDAQAYLSPKRPIPNKYIGFNIESTRKINRKKINQKQQDRRKSDLYSYAGFEGFQENFGNTQHENLRDAEEFRRKSMLISEPRNKENSLTAKTFCQSNYSQDSPELEMTILKIENRKLKEQVDNLQTCRLYYQRELIDQMKKEEEKKKLYIKQISQLKEQYEKIANSEEEKFSQTTQTISRLSDLEEKNKEKRISQFNEPNLSSQKLITCYSSDNESQGSSDQTKETLIKI